MRTAQTEIPFQRHRATSEAARDSKTAEHQSELRRVLAYFTMGAATDDEVQIALHMDGSTERPRRIWLTDHGFLVATDRTRRTRTGRYAVVWEWTGKHPLDLKEKRRCER